MRTDLLAEYWPTIWNGFLITVLLSFVVLAVSTPIAFFLALARQSQLAVLRWPAGIYVNVFRALPVLIILYFAFYALPQFGMSLTAFQAATAGLVIASSAYLAEDIRAGLAAVDPGQRHAATALGIPYWRSLRRIYLPQAIPIALPPYITRAIIIVKGTALASLVAVNDLTAEAVRAISITYRPYEFLAVAAILYLVINALLAALQSFTERHIALRYGRVAAGPAAVAQ